jgi:hypothetical protein
MKRVAILALALVALSAAPAAAVDTGADVRDQLLRVKRATRAYADVAAAEAAGYVEFLDCFDSEAGGMGQHYVDLAALDTTVVATHPESIVYEIGADGSLTMVAVEYIVPNSPEVAADPPMLFDRHFHLNTDLDVWVLHAWVWKKNPTGMFEDYNPRVAACP